MRTIEQIKAFLDEGNYCFITSNKDDLEQLELFEIVDGLVEERLEIFLYDYSQGAYQLSVDLNGKYNVMLELEQLEEILKMCPEGMTFVNERLMQLYPRQCTETGEGMFEGYVIGDCETYSLKAEDKVKELIQEAGYISMEEAYNDEYYYYTQWEVDLSEMEMESAYSSDGTEYIWNERLQDWFMQN
jgi:hypothetical protein